ncbi:hypothetical protein L3049_16365 [Labilibaculum sp. DW002]|uniref:Uncharacterized protein n=1 Tax=Paralabilibaculum antarcticum TaxID=2912572 RepID=A0ABT5VVX8_9BACT|nr:hypothetical protein [Labilibaculum sp. DW002]MDE5419569.1 hypothetical protein [Labilibaculum sp. DW002]
MGVDAQPDNVIKTINESGSDKAAVVNRPQILARPLYATIRQIKSFA